ncbi:MAG: DNA polymerase elongation subunit (family B), partial [Thermoplasmatales archaeon]|nr:DNA polymerase elongation subunit (family B) [Thermoplasmatales archaeon]
MNDMLLGISPEYLYFHGKTPKKVSEYHGPYFLVFCQKERNIDSARNDLRKKWENNNSDESPLSKIERIGEIENYRSFWDFSENRKIFKVYTKKSYFVPEVSDYLFFNHGLYTAEHDIPYHQRALVDLAAKNQSWLFDTNGEKKKLKVLVYDIETTQYEEGKSNIPIDIIGYSDFDIVFESAKNLENEEFSFDILDCPSHWEDMEIKQIISHNVDEEIENLNKFLKTAMEYDIISGHNILGFDNLNIYGRVNWILKSHQETLSNDQRKTFQDFVSKYSRLDKSFHFGIRSEVVQFYPCSFDTYMGARKFYSFLDEFSLKSVAPFLGVKIKDRIILTPSQIKIDTRTLKYNKHDVQEQLGVTLNLIQQALPLAFTTCMPFDMLLSKGAVNMWDHMALIRGAMQKKIMPPICRVMSISQALLWGFKGCKTREEIVRESKRKKEQLSKDFIRVIKYGDEMPKWMEDPYVIYNEKTKDADERLNYHMPGGMTIKPDKDAMSHFIPWWYVVVADVGAMYPT